LNTSRYQDKASEKSGAFLYLKINNTLQISALLNFTDFSIDHRLKNKNATLQHLQIRFLYLQQSCVIFSRKIDNYNRNYFKIRNEKENFNN